jgi:hypothetical protein
MARGAGNPARVFVMKTAVEQATDIKFVIHVDDGRMTASNDSGGS